MGVHLAGVKKGGRGEKIGVESGLERPAILKRGSGSYTEDGKQQK